MKPKGGDGWLRLLEFKADGTTVQAYDYSPTRDERNESEAVTLDPPAAGGSVFFEGHRLTYDTGESSG